MHRLHRLLIAWLLGLCALVPAAPARAGATAAHVPAAADTLPAPMARALKLAGVPARGVGLYVVPVDGPGATPLAAWNAEQPLLMASTAKLVTSMAALGLLGPTHQWPSQAWAAAPPSAGRVAGDLVIAAGPAGVTVEDLRRWVRRLREQGVREVSGRIVLQDVDLLQDPPSTTGAISDGGGEDAGVLHVVLQATASGAVASLRPAVAGVKVVSDVAPGSTCTVYARWKSVQPPVAWISGRWGGQCGAREAATLSLPDAMMGVTRAVAPTATGPSAAAVAAQLWREAGGRARGGVVERHGALRPAASGGWTQSLGTSLSDRLADINKVSLNAGARRLLLALSDSMASADSLARAQARVQTWLAGQGLQDDDLRIELGSGQSRNERGKARALASLLHDAWRGGTGLQPLLQSLPVAGIDGTMAHRLRDGPALGRAFLKTGTLSDTRALAGYVVGLSGRVYAVAALVNHPQAARALPALDALVDWVVVNG